MHKIPTFRGITIFISLLLYPKLLGNSPIFLYIHPKRTTFAHDFKTHKIASNYKQKHT